MNNLRLLIPQPFRGMITQYQFLSSLKTNLDASESNDIAAKEVTYLEDNVVRTVIASAAIFAVYSLGYSAKAVLIAAAITSLPATLLAIGSTVMYFSTAALISAVSTLAFKSIAYAMASLVAGYLITFNYDLCFIGVPTHVDDQGCVVEESYSIPPFPKGVVEHLFLMQNCNELPEYRKEHAKKMVETYFYKERFRSPAED